MIRRCDPQLEFIYRLFSGMHIHTSGDSLSSDMRWQREYKRQIDITQLSQQVETYDIEVDWHALGRIALDCGITIKEGDIVPLPLFRFRRFVQTEFECSSDPTVFFSHRTFNQRLAAMLATYGLTAWNKSLNQEELKTWYEARWMPVFRFGGNYREDETTHLIGEQQEIYEAVSGETSKFLQYVEDDEQMRLRKRYLDDLYRLKENYPVLTYVRAKTEGCTILRFRICRYQTRVARSEYGREVNTPSSSWYKRALLAFCGATLVEYSYQWLRDSTFLKIVFPKDCRSAHACTVGGMLESSDAEFSDGVLFSSVHREHGSPDGSDAYLRCYVIPKFRATVRFLVPELLEIMFLTLVALIWGFIPWSGVSAHVPASLFLTVGITQLGAAFLAGDINESPFLTNALKTPRTTNDTGVHPALRAVDRHIDRYGRNRQDPVDRFRRGIIRTNHGNHRVCDVRAIRICHGRMGGHLPVLAHIGSAGENATLIGGHRLARGPHKQTERCSLAETGRRGP